MLLMETMMMGPEACSDGSVVMTLHARRRRLDFAASTYAMASALLPGDSPYCMALRLMDDRGD